MTGSSQRSVREPRRQVPVARDVDVVVVGGGTAGAVAAIAAARIGADTLLIERYGRLGGNLTWGWMNKPQGAIIGGIPGEIWDRVIELGGAIKVPVSWQEKMVRGFYFMSPSDPMTVERVYSEMAEEEGVGLMLDTLAVDAIREGNRIKGVVVENRSGRQAVLAKVVVDASGEGRIAARAGAPFEVGRTRDRKTESYRHGKLKRITEPMTVMFRVGDVDLLRYAKYQTKAKRSYLPDKLGNLDDVKYTIYGGVMYRDFTTDPAELKLFPTDGATLKTGRGVHEIFVNATRAHGLFGFDADDVTSGEIMARKQVVMIAEFLKKNVPGFEKSYVVDTAITIQPREARRFIGEYILTERDIWHGAKFPDTVGRMYSPIDIKRPGHVDAAQPATGGRTQTPEYDLPYRCLVTKNIDGLLVAGRQISADHWAHGSTRAISVCMYSGQAAGAAAALSAQSDTAPRKLDVKRLQASLAEWGTILFESVFERICTMYPELTLQGATVRSPQSASK